MTLWIAMALLAAFVALASLAPLYRSRAGRVSGDAGTIYRDQLEELDRDRDRGLIGQEEAEAARVEIARRLIQAEKDKGEDRDGASAWRTVSAVLIILAPVAALGLYLAVGSPDLPDQPREARLTAPPDEMDLQALVARVEAHLAESPEDGEGWEVLAPVYGRLGRFDEAAFALRNAIRVLGPSVIRETSLGEALVAASDNRITPEARAAFTRAADLDEDAILARFYLAKALEQDGDLAAAATAWRAIVARGGAEDSWMPAAQASLDAVVAQLDPEAGADAVEPGPDAEQVAAAAELSADERQEMIEGMVAGLAERLRDEPDDAPGWARLIRSYVVLGRQDSAETAVDEARAALSDDEDGLAIIEAAAREAGLIETEESP